MTRIGRVSKETSFTSWKTYGMQIFHLVADKFSSENFHHLKEILVLLLREAE
jgi:hypothetical protein